MSNVEIIIDIWPTEEQKPLTIHESYHESYHETPNNRSFRQKPPICPCATDKLEETILLLTAIIISQDAEASQTDLKSATQRGGGYRND